MFDHFFKLNNFLIKNLSITVIIIIIINFIIIIIKYYYLSCYFYYYKKNVCSGCVFSYLFNLMFDHCFKLNNFLIKNLPITVIIIIIINFIITIKYYCLSYYFYYYKKMFVVDIFSVVNNN